MPGSDVQKSIGKPSSSTPANLAPSSIRPPTVEVSINILGSILTLLNNTLDSLAADGEAK